MGIGSGKSSKKVPLTIGDGVHVYITGQAEPYATGPQNNVETRNQNMTDNTRHFTI